MTDQLIQCGKLLNVRVEDHVIITEQACYSFFENGLMQVLTLSKKYVPEYKQRQELKRDMEKTLEKKIEIRKAKETKG